MMLPGMIFRLQFDSFIGSALYFTTCDITNAETFFSYNCVLYDVNDDECKYVYNGVCPKKNFKIVET